jgi:hypothetical protein
MRQRSIGWGAFPDAAIRVLILIAAQQPTGNHGTHYDNEVRRAPGGRRKDCGR